MALLDPITNAPKNQKIALGVMACVVVAALGYFLLLSPKQTERDVLRQQSEQVRGELAQAQALEASLRGFRAQAEALRKRLEAAQERLPTEKEMPGLYRQISDLAFQSGLGLAPVRSRDQLARSNQSELQSVAREQRRHDDAGYVGERYYCCR